MWRSKVFAKEKKVINTAAILVNGKWSLTTVYDLKQAEMLSSGRSDAREDVESLTSTTVHMMRWRHGLQRYYTNLESAVANSAEACRCLDEGSRDIFLDLDNLESFSDDEFIREWILYYEDITQIRRSNTEKIRLLTYDKPGLPWERGFSKENRNIELISLEPFDIPLGVVKPHSYEDNIGYRSGGEFHVATFLCWVDMVTESLQGAPITTAKIRTAIETGGERLMLITKCMLVGSVSFVTSLERLRPTDFGGTSLTVADFNTLEIEMQAHGITLLRPPELDSNELDSNELDSMDLNSIDLRHIRRLFTSDGRYKPKSLLGSANEQAWKRLVRDKILFQKNGPSLTTVVFEDVREKSWSSLRDIRGGAIGVNFNVNVLPKQEIMQTLRRRAGTHTNTALERLRDIKVDGDAAKGHISKIKQSAALVYVLAVIVLSIMTVALNWKESENLWERLFAGIELATFALVGVFGLVKLAGEDENIIRNTFLGFAKLRSEEDLERYLKTSDVPLALALYEGKLDWANSDYTGYCLTKPLSAVAITSGLSVASARKAGIYPIGETVAVDLRTWRLRKVTSDGSRDELFRLGGPLAAGDDITYVPQLPDNGVFR